MRGLTSDFAIGAGTTPRPPRRQRLTQRGWSLGDESASCARGTPTPRWSTTRSRARSRCAPRAPPIRREAARYASFTLTGGAGGARSIEAPLWSASGPGSISREVQGTPYEGMYGLARRLTAGAPTPYDAAQRIEFYLRSNFEYKQNVPNRTYPLPAFISQDRAGYCQQFSGAMALMLRMLGIPSRVAAGFAPGGRDPDRSNYLIDDTDAHNWVEVFFPRIGWATFDPTPPAAPAAAQLDDELGVTDPLPTDNSAPGRQAPDVSGGETPKPAPQQGAIAKSGQGSSGPARGRSSEPSSRSRGLPRSAPTPSALDAGPGWDPTIWPTPSCGARPRPPQAQEAAAARGDAARRRRTCCSGSAGPAAARYATELETRRYRDPAAPPPSMSERRALRRALISAVASPCAGAAGAAAGWTGSQPA